MAIRIKEIRTKSRCVVTITVLLAGKFTIPTQTIAGEEMSRIVTINRALTGKLYVDMNVVFQCDYEKLLELDYPSGVSTSQAAVQVTYFTLYKHLKKYNLS